MLLIHQNHTIIKIEEIHLPKKTLSPPSPPTSHLFIFPSYFSFIVFPYVSILLLNSDIRLFEIPILFHFLRSNLAESFWNEKRFITCNHFIYFLIDLERTYLSFPQMGREGREEGLIRMF